MPKESLMLFLILALEQSSLKRSTLATEIILRRFRWREFLDSIVKEQAMKIRAFMQVMEFYLYVND